MVYIDYYKIFKQYSMSELLSMCEHNKLSIYGDKNILADRLAIHFSEKNKPTKITLCMNSIKNILFKI